MNVRDIKITRENAYTAIIRGLLSRKDLGRGDYVHLKSVPLPVALRLNRFIDMNVIINDSPYLVFSGSSSYLKNLYDDEYVLNLEDADEFYCNSALDEDEEEEIKITEQEDPSFQESDEIIETEEPISEEDVSDEINNTGSGFDPTDSTDNDRLSENVEELSSSDDEMEEIQEDVAEVEEKEEHPTETTQFPTYQYHYKKKKKK